MIDLHVHACVLIIKVIYITIKHRNIYTLVSLQYIRTIIGYAHEFDFSFQFLFTTILTKKLKFSLKNNTKLMYIKSEFLFFLYI